METKWLKRELLLANEGQIEGLPSNPRFIRDEKFEKLKKSIEEDPEFMQVRPLAVFPFGGAYVIVGGNMRFRACEWDELPCVVLPEDTPVEKLKRFVIKDNAAFGQWDFDALANEWDAGDLAEWGVDVDCDAETAGNMEMAGSEGGTEKIALRIDESYNFLVLRFDTDIDWLYLQSLFPLEKRVYLTKKNGDVCHRKECHVVDGVEFIKTISHED